MWKMAIYIKSTRSLSCPYILFCSLLTISQVFTSRCKTAAWLCNQSGLETVRIDGQRREAGSMPDRPGIGLASCTQVFSTAGYWVEGAWHLITYHNEFCFSRLRLDWEKLSRDNSSCWTQIVLYVVFSVPIFQAASQLRLCHLPNAYF